jgi:hypothetical protein
VPNGDLIFAMTRYLEEDRISSSSLYEKLLSRYKKNIFEEKEIEINNFQEIF